MVFPEIDPVAISLGPLKIHWYGLMYLLAFFSAWGLALFRIHRFHLSWTNEQVQDLIFFAALGVVIGGRVGYMIFYQWLTLVHSPWVILKIWQGGMSFHGGLLGVLIALGLFARKSHRSFWSVVDFAVPLVPLGLAFGRLGNFINGELWGRITDVPWGMVFPTADHHIRHPSQLYECGLEGILLFICMSWYARKPRKEGQISAIFLMGYALARMAVECWREPDVHRGFIAFGWLTEGQLLSLPMFLFGLWLLWRKKHENISPVH